MENCIFCKIASGEIPSATLYEDEDFRVILDLGPATKGHALILPKKHAANIAEMPDDLLGRAASVAKKVAVAMKEGLSCDGVNIRRDMDAGQAYRRDERRNTECGQSKITINRKSSEPAILRFGAFCRSRESVRLTNRADCRLACTKITPACSSR